MLKCPHTYRILLIVGSRNIVCTVRSGCSEFIGLCAQMETSSAEHGFTGHVEISSAVQELRVCFRAC